MNATTRYRVFCPRSRCRFDAVAPVGFDAVGVAFVVLPSDTTGRHTTLADYIDSRCPGCKKYGVDAVPLKAVADPLIP